MILGLKSSLLTLPPTKNGSFVPWRCCGYEHVATHPCVARGPGQTPVCPLAIYGEPGLLGRPRLASEQNLSFLKQPIHRGFEVWLLIRVLRSRAAPSPSTSGGRASWCSAAWRSP